MPACQGLVSLGLRNPLCVANAQRKVRLSDPPVNQVIAVAAERPAACAEEYARTQNDPTALPLEGYKAEKAGVNQNEAPQGSRDDQPHNDGP